MADTKPGPADPPAPGTPLHAFWNDPVSKLTSIQTSVSPAQAERHRIYLLLLMAIVNQYWNYFKKGRKGKYSLSPLPPTAYGDPYEYKGHNIAAIAVDQRGRVLDFDFNHNKLFHSSAEHAEARLVRRIFSLAQISDLFDGIQTDGKRSGEYEFLSEITIYTSLESCAQCAGMMALANVKCVVYLQEDPGMYRIGNILYNLRSGIPEPPRPIPAREAGAYSYQKRLEDGFADFSKRIKTTPYWEDGVNSDTTPSISSYLATPMAKDVFDDGYRDFANLLNPPIRLKYPHERPYDRSGNVVANGLTNREVVDNASRFLGYALGNGRRGTPHGS